MSLYPNFFYHETIKTYTIAFGTLFDNIYVSRFNEDGTVDNIERVVCNMSTKQKFFTRTEDDPKADKNIAMKYPRMSYEVVDIKYDPTRKLQTTGFVSALAATAGSNQLQYNPVPYNLIFNLYITAKHQIEGYQILEQILPFFTPDTPLTINIVPEMCLQTPVPVELTSVDWDDNYDGSFIERRSIIWTLSFAIKGYFFAPIFTKSVIKEADVSINSPDGIATIVGTPNYNNLPPSEITAEDPWTYSYTLNETPGSDFPTPSLNLFQLNESGDLYTIDSLMNWWDVGE